MESGLGSQKCWSEPASRKAFPSKNGVHRNACCQEMPPFSYCSNQDFAHFQALKPVVFIQMKPSYEELGWLSNTGDTGSPASAAREVGAGISHGIQHYRRKHGKVWVVCFCLPVFIPEVPGSRCNAARGEVGKQTKRTAQGEILAPLKLTINITDSRQ